MKADTHIYPAILFQGTLHKGPMLFSFLGSHFKFGCLPENYKI